VKKKEEFISVKIPNEIDIQNLRAKINSYGGFEQELKSIEEIKGVTNGFGKELVDEKHESASEVEETMKKNAKNL